jgi:peptidoglycan/LPS O-acetylase OafA/YrhL
MFGAYRFILATMVIISHIHRATLPFGGGYAVFGFYLLSGYLITLVLNENYGFTFDGIKRFLINRALRIYPVYLVCLGLMIVLLLVAPWLPPQIAYSIVLPSSLGDWISNVLIFGMNGWDKVRMIPPAWVLNIELFFYIAIAFSLGKSRLIACIWFCVSILYAVYGYVLDLSLTMRYNTILAGSLPVSIGAIVYHFRDYLKVGRWAAPVAVVLYGLNVVSARTLQGQPGGTNFYYFFYISLIASTIALISLKDVKAPRFDKTLGELSYPMAAIFILLTFRYHPKYRGWDFFLLTYLYTVLFSFLINGTIERTIKMIREKIRPVRPLVSNKRSLL